MDGICILCERVHYSETNPTDKLLYYFQIPFCSTHICGYTIVLTCYTKNLSTKEK